MNKKEKIPIVKTIEDISKTIRNLSKKLSGEIENIQKKLQDLDFWNRIYRDEARSFQKNYESLEERCKHILYGGNTLQYRVRLIEEKLDLSQQVMGYCVHHGPIEDKAKQ